MNTSNFLVIYSLLVIFAALESHVIANLYSACEPFDCGNITNISYPFRQNKKPFDFCGHPAFVLDCPESDSDYPLLQVMSQKYLVLSIDPNTRILKLAREDLSETTCPENPTNATFESTPFNYTPKDHAMSLLYDCDPVSSQLLPDVKRFSCATSNVSAPAYFAPAGYGFGSLWHCNVTVLVPVAEEAMIEGGYMSQNGQLDVSKVLKGGFEVEWSDMDRTKCNDCLASKGHCGFDATAKQFKCICPDSKVYNRSCSSTTQPSVLYQPVEPPAQAQGMSPCFLVCSN